MIRIIFYSVLLLAGMATSQLADLISWQPLLHSVTMVCLSYIMIEVGLEFSADMKHPSAYAMDGAVAAVASGLPWIFCALYFVAMFGTRWNEALLVACFAAPTSAGVLFTMLASAGLGATWLFKKARILAVFDDLTTILLLIPLQMMFVGCKPELLAVVFLMAGLLFIGYRWLNQSSWPVGKPWLVVYGIVIVGACQGFQALTHIRFEVLLPAFVMGCVMRHHSLDAGDDPHSWLDQSVKAVFMFLVGCSLPRVSMGTMSLGIALTHVMALTLLSNLGKCFPLLCYGSEATRRERLGLSIAMFPRGEVGAGVLLMALGYGIKGLPVVLGSLSLALNLLLTVVFIMVVVKLSARKAT
jgi:Kef-type K+ transport system membrane component KefB